MKTCVQFIVKASSIGPAGQMAGKHRASCGGFTLIELVVAVALLTMMLAFSGVIFSVSINSHRLVTANAEIMQKFRAITDQLNADFKGLRKDAPMLILFRQDPCDILQRYDQVMFFADGDFQSTRLYNGDPPAIPLEPAPTGLPVKGNVARIYYGQARCPDPRDNIIKYPFYIGVAPNEENRRYRILARRQHILTADNNYFLWPTPAPDPLIVASSFAQWHPIKSMIHLNDYFEHDMFSLAQWKILERDVYDLAILDTCFNYPPVIDKTNTAASIEDTVHNLMAEGVGSFAVQLAYAQPADTFFPYTRVLWYPSDNFTIGGAAGPVSYSHFDIARVLDNVPSSPIPAYEYSYLKTFGVFLNIPEAQLNYWADPGKKYMHYNPDPLAVFPTGFFPKALKFTFTLYDSNGVIENGRVFTHIVYLDD